MFILSSLSQALVVRGRAERSYSSGTPPAGLSGQPGRKGQITESGEPGASHKTTTRDAYEGNQGKETISETGNEIEKSDKKQPGHGVKYWLSERSVGEFSRTFNFPAPVEQDVVSATFRDGILEIVVPKVKKQGARRITIY